MREGGSGLGTHVHPWLIHVNVWQNQYSIVKQNEVKIKIKKKKKILQEFPNVHLQLFKYVLRYPFLPRVCMVLGEVVYYLFIGKNDFWTVIACLFVLVQILFSSLISFVTLKTYHKLHYDLTVPF